MEKWKGRSIFYHFFLSFYLMEGNKGKKGGAYFCSLFSLFFLFNGRE